MRIILPGNMCENYKKKRRKWWKNNSKNWEKVQEEKANMPYTYKIHKNKCKIVKTSKWWRNMQYQSLTIAGE